MTTLGTRKAASSFIVTILLALVLTLLSGSTPLGHDRGPVYALQAPPVVAARTFAQVGLASFLDNEAGIAAYTKAPTAIDLADVRGEYRTIERETADYIIGSVGLPDYTEDHDPHVYVHIDGWVLAYYLSDIPACFIFDLKHYDGATIASTKLENALTEILFAVDVVSFTATYYDFRFPNATHLMLIAEAAYDEGSESFDVILPADFTYYDRSWAHAVTGGGSWYGNFSDLYLDDAPLSDLRTYGGWWDLAHGALTLSQLLPGPAHTIRLDFTEGSTGHTCCCLALVYREVVP